MFQRKPLTTAITMVFGAMAAASVNVQADATFFPHVVVSDTVTTIVSVINTTDQLYSFSGDKLKGNERNGKGFLHYALFYKDAASNSEPCLEFNTYLPSSINDVQTIDLGADDNSGVLFEPTTKNVINTGYDYALGTQARLNLDKGEALRGYLLVDNASSGSGSESGGYDEDEPTIFGEAFVVEFGVGATWGYAAFSKQDNSENPEADYFDNEFDFEDAASVSGYPVEVLPLGGPEAVTSSFMVTPVVNPKAPSGESYADSDMSENPGVNTAELYLTTSKSKEVNWGTERGMWDRDENKISGGIIRSVTCVGRVPIRTLISDNFSDNHKLVNGGWGRLVNGAVYTYKTNNGAVDTSTFTAREYDAAVIYKLEYGTELNGLSVGGTWNNAFMIPNDYEVFAD
jgi:hypothetical protein